MLLYLCSMFLPKCNSSRLANLNSKSSQKLGGTCTQKLSDVAIQKSEGREPQLWNNIKALMP